MTKVEITGCNRIQETLLLQKLSKICKLNGSVKIKLLQEIMQGKCLSYWYGGDVALVLYKGFTFAVAAVGDMSVRLLDKSDGHEIVYLKNKNNEGRFFDELKGYIKNDNELEKCKNGLSSKYILQFDDNNWWECFVTDTQKQIHDLMWSLDADNIFDAIAEVIENADTIISSVEKEASA